MTTQPRRGGPTDPSHDEELRRGILRTEISRPLALALVIGFLLAIGGLPLAQAVLEKARDEDSMLLDVFRRTPTRQSFSQYEKDLEDMSYAREWVRPRLQQALAARGGFGNGKGVIGRDGWLFYAPGVAFTSGPGFLAQQQHDLRRAAALDAGDPVPHPDPRPAIFDLHRALAARGVKLILFPVPDKAQLQPHQLHGRGGGGPWPVAGNRDFPRFVAELRAGGIDVFAPVPAEVAAGERRFLVQDTHWTPAWMEETARALAARLSPLLTGPRRAWKRVPQTVQRVGDIVDMLKLPDDQRLFTPETVTISQVATPEGALWEPHAEAEVLLLGDSFTNIFSLGAMGWGEAAGFGAHLAAALGRDVDVIARNDAGAHATRQLLSEALAAGEDRLKGKRVVIWQFASRELATGDWKPYSYTLGAAP